LDIRSDSREASGINSQPTFFGYLREDAPTTRLRRYQDSSHLPRGAEGLCEKRAADEGFIIGYGIVIEARKYSASKQVIAIIGFIPISRHFGKYSTC
jgi:hypothetical protein